jgi:peptidoglycan/xylan/chitin deacetylase (PgdA/CDA1 family)
MNSTGIFTVSLDFELYWGMRDKCTIDQYRENLLGVREAIPKMLEVFSRTGIHATWATVGFLFCRDTNDLRNNLPAKFPNYATPRFSPYRYLDQEETLDPAYHFAPDLVKVISQYPGQEIGTHTLSHYYCLEAGQSKEEFREDIATAIRLAGRLGHAIHSLVFPRNQWNPDYLAILNEFGIRCFRGNETGWCYKASNNEEQKPLIRATRLLDSYFNLTGHHTYSPHTHLKENSNIPLNIPASRFLRPYSPRLSLMDGFKFRRITRAMDYAAQNHHIYHLWWHPHNFGRHTNENIDFLGRIGDHFVNLKQGYGMRSLNMSEIARLGSLDDQ